MAANTVTIKSTEPDLKVSITALLDGAGAVVTGGYGGWDMITRPRRQSVTHWGGRNPFSMDLAIVLDGHQRFDTIETECNNLDRLALPFPNPGGTPPVVQLIGEAIPHQDILEWVIDGLEWGATIRDRNGHRTRQHVVIKLIRYVQIDKIQVTAAAKSRTKGGGGGVRTVPVKKGDTLQKISARYLGYGHRWREIRALNPGLDDPDNLKGRTTVKIPPKKPKAKTK
jgi:LysM domain